MKSSCVSCFYLNKVDMLKSKFGFNHAFSYKEEHDLHFDKAKTNFNSKFKLESITTNHL